MSIKKLASETAIYGVSSILSRIVNYIVLTPYLTGVFGPTKYGVVSEVYVYAALLMVFFTYRMETAFFRFGSKKGALDRTFSTASIALLFSTIILVSLLVVAAPSLGQLLDVESENYTRYFIWFAFILGFDTLSAIPFARLRLTNRPIKFAILKILNIVIYIAGIFFFLELCPTLIENGWTNIERFYNPIDRVQYVFIANFLGSLGLFILLIPEYLHVKRIFDRELFKKMLIYAAPLIVVGLAAIINQQVNILLIKFFSNSADAKRLVGEFSACAKIAILMSLVIQAFNYAAEPFFFRNADRSDSKGIYADVGQAFALVGSFIFLGIVLYLDVLKYLIRNSDFWVALGVVPILALAFLFLGLYYNFSIWFKLKDQTIMGAYIAVGGSIITLTLNFILIPKITYYGAAWSALACYFFMAAASYWTGQRHYPIPYPIKKMMFYVGLAIAVYIISDLLITIPENNILYTLLYGSFWLLVYAGIIGLIERKRIYKR